MAITAREYRSKVLDGLPTPPIQTLPARWGLTHRFPDGHRYGAMRPYNISAGLLSLRRVLSLRYCCATPYGGLISDSVALTELIL